ncbi:uracil-DNA glycosylase [Sphingomonas sp. Leaf412]|nr:uracil-DNA glycosylase [Sphingomonas sp. Leaf412]
MGADQNLDWHGLAASALEWWRDAGVDTIVEDEAFPWLDAPAPVAPVVASAPVPATAAMPDTLPAFLTWRAGAAAPEADWGGTAIAGSGPADATLMIIVDCPERGDRTQLMEGPTGALFDRMLAAIGQSRDTVALAAVCSRRPPTGRVPRDTEARLGEIARHHAGLAAPKRLLAMGDAATRALLTMNATEARGRLHTLQHKSGSMTQVVATHHPRVLIERPAMKMEAWRDLLLLTGETDT